MPRTPSRISRVLFSLAVACGLAFGAQSALANGSRGTECEYYPPNGRFGLACTVGPAGDSYCDQECKNRVGSWSEGHCDQWTGCCLCIV